VGFHAITSRLWSPGGHLPERVYNDGAGKHREYKVMVERIRECLK